MHIVFVLLRAIWWHQSTMKPAQLKPAQFGRVMEMNIKHKYYIDLANYTKQEIVSFQTCNYKWIFKFLRTVILYENWFLNLLRNMFMNLKIYPDTSWRFGARSNTRPTRVQTSNFLPNSFCFQKLLFTHQCDDRRHF